MELTYRSRNGRMMFKLNGNTQKDLFRELAQIQAVFEADDQCGRCQSQAVNFETRTVEDNDYYSLRCLSCGAELRFGQHRQGGTLFAKRQGDSGGWQKFQAIEAGVPPNGAPQDQRGAQKH